MILEEEEWVHSRGDIPSGQESRDVIQDMAKPAHVVIDLIWRRRRCCIRHLFKESSITEGACQRRHHREWAHIAMAFMAMVGAMILCIMISIIIITITIIIIMAISVI